MGKLCDMCGSPIPAYKRSDTKFCSAVCRGKKYTQTEMGRRKSVEKTRRYQLTEKGKETKRKADAKYYQSHKEKWFTPELAERNRFSAAARRLMQKTNRNYICVECGDNSLKLDVHHIDKKWWNNDILNLEYRCKKCHNKVHGKIPNTVAASDHRRKIPYTTEEIILYLKQAAKQIGNIPFSQTSYTNLGKGRPTVKTIIKYKDWKDWMNSLK